MAVQPTTAQLRGGDSHAFTCDVTGCTWAEPKVGTISVHGQTCIYTAPSKSRLWFSRQVELAADANNANAGVAVITLTSAPNWIITLGAIYMLSFFALVFFVVWLWPPAPAAPWIGLTPPTVTVVPGFQQQFDARIWEARDQGVTWSATDGIISPTGMFTAPATSNNNTVVVTATSAADHNLAQSALVVLNPHGLAVRPASLTLGSSETASFETMENTSLTNAASAAGGANSQAANTPAPAATQIEWAVSDPAVTLKEVSGGKVTVQAGPNIQSLTRVILTASDKADRKRQASAVIYLSAAATPVGAEIATYELKRDTRLLILVMLMGALGALLGASRSLANFVGNDAFFPRWSLFYVFRPTFGAGLALLVFFGYRIGAVVGVKGVAPADPFAATFVAGMVGLFADTVMQKLKDLITALLPSQDDRKDKIAASTTAAPSIESAQGTKLNNELTVKGQYFVSGASVILNGKPRTTVFVSSTELRVTLDTTDSAGDVKVVVINPDKHASPEFKGTIV